jgi:hypothetical protein
MAADDGGMCERAASLRLVVAALGHSSPDALVA